MVFLKMGKAEKGVTETIQFLFDDRKIIVAKKVLLNGNSERMRSHNGRQIQFADMIELMDKISETPIPLPEANEWYNKWRNKEFPEYEMITFNTI